MHEIKPIAEIKAWLKHSRLAQQDVTDDLAKETLALQKELQKFFKKGEIKLAKLQSQLAECYNWNQMHYEGLLLKAHLYLWRPGLKSLRVTDWEQQNCEREIPLTPPLSGQEEIAWRFRKSKKLRLGIPHLEREVEKIKSILAKLLYLIEALEFMSDINEIMELRHLLFPAMKKQPAVQPKNLPALPYREYWTASGHPIWVGKKALDNEKLSFGLAHGSDWWLHVEGYPGSHVILRGFKGNEPDYEALQDALQLALFYSQGKKQKSANVILTQPKHLSRLGKGKKNIGKVQISKFKTFHVELDSQRIEKIKKRPFEQTEKKRPGSY